jgi:hypothetical protein
MCGQKGRQWIGQSCVLLIGACHPYLHVTVLCVTALCVTLCDRVCSCAHTAAMQVPVLQ